MNNAAATAALIDIRRYAGTRPGGIVTYTTTRHTVVDITTDTDGNTIAWYTEACGAGPYGIPVDGDFNRLVG